MITKKKNGTRAYEPSTFTSKLTKTQKSENQPNDIHPTQTKQKKNTEHTHNYKYPIEMI